jgi:predicted DNA-binding transcriptional regulator AlpA
MARGRWQRTLGMRRETTVDHYKFVLNFTLPGARDNPERYRDVLHSSGCGDAAVEIGQYGMIGLDVTCAADSAEDAVRSAVENVRTAIPGATLVQAGPDLVGLSEMAAIFGFSRQNMRKYAIGQSGGPRTFPLPVVVGDPSLWHLAEIIAWLKLHTRVQPPERVLEVSKAAAKLNFEVEKQRLSRILACS